MDDLKQQLKRNSALANYWKERIEEWILREQLNLTQNSLDEIGRSCAYDAIYSLEDHLRTQRKRLEDMGVREEDILRPPFFEN